MTPQYPATPAKRLKVQRKGQFAYSPDLVSAIVLIAAIMGLCSVASGLVQGVSQEFVRVFTWQEAILTPITAQRVSGFHFHLLGHWLGVCAPFFALVIIAAIAGHFVQRRFLFAPERDIASGDNIDPVKGLARFFSLSSLARVIFGFLKLAVLTTVVWLFFQNQLSTLASLPNGPLDGSLAESGKIVKTFLWQLTGAIAVLSMMDYAWQYWKFEQDIRMTEQEMRDELKNQ